MRLSLVMAILVLFAGKAAHADTFSYSFSEDPQYGMFSFTYVSPVLITTFTTFTPVTCMVTSRRSCDAVQLDPVGGSVNFLQGGAYEAFFSNRSPDFFTVGTHTELFTTLTITDNVSTAATPEPSSLLLLSTGTVALFGAARRRSFLSVAAGR